MLMKQQSQVLCLSYSLETMATCNNTWAWGGSSKESKNKRLGSTDLESNSRAERGSGTESINKSINAPRRVSREAADHPPAPVPLGLVQGC